MWPRNVIMAQRFFLRITLHDDKSEEPRKGSSFIIVIFSHHIVLFMPTFVGGTTKMSLDRFWTVSVWNNSPQLTALTFFQSIGCRCRFSRYDRWWKCTIIWPICIECVALGTVHVVACLKWDTINMERRSDRLLPLRVMKFHAERDPTLKTFLLVYDPSLHQNHGGRASFQEKAINLQPSYISNH